MKNTGKLTILMIAVVAIGVFSLPAVLSVGSGQHKFNNGANVDCGKCHANGGDKVYGEIGASGTTQYNTLGSGIGVQIHNSSTFWYVAGSYQCKKCHEILPDPDPTLKTQHTNVKVQVTCIQCHSSYYVKLTNNSDAHKGFGLAAGSGSTGSDATYACIGCHTAVTVSGSPSYTYGAKVTTDGLTIGNGPAAPLP